MRSLREHLNSVVFFVCCGESDNNSGFHIVCKSSSANVLLRRWTGRHHPDASKYSTRENQRHQNGRFPTLISANRTSQQLCSDDSDNQIRTSPNVDKLLKGYTQTSAKVVELWPRTSASIVKLLFFEHRHQQVWSNCCSSSIVRTQQVSSDCCSSSIVRHQQVSTNCSKCTLSRCRQIVQNAQSAGVVKLFKMHTQQVSSICSKCLSRH